MLSKATFRYGRSSSCNASRWIFADHNAMAAAATATITPRFSVIWRRQEVKVLRMDVEK